MDAILVRPTMAKVRWKLRMVMADRKITNKALAEALSMNPVSISKLKSNDELPGIGGESLAKICEAIAALSSQPCTLDDLVEYIPDLK